MATKEGYEVIYRLLTQKNVTNMDPTILENDPDKEMLLKIIRHLNNIRDLSDDIATGDIKSEYQGAGFMFSNMKKIQSQLRHIIWQCDMIAKGDYTKTLEHPQDISHAFEKMLQNIAMTKNKYESIALIDVLTGINNRRAYDTYAYECFIGFSHHRQPTSILYLDIDNFKSFNDTLGHLVGDFVLKEFCRRIKLCLRKDDFFARIGGDEFIIFLPNTTFKHAEVVSRKIIHCITKQPFFYSEEIEPLHIQTSVGYTSFLKSDDSFETIVNRADRALYLAKQNGKNQAYGKQK